MEVINYSNLYQPDFKKLNMEWLEKYNVLETHDLEILDNPEDTVIAKGGHIFLGQENGQIIATAGISKESETEYELIKMAVDPAHRRRGVSKILLDRCLEKARELKADKIFLYSNSQLRTALNLYEQYGFQYVPAVNTPFVTADIKMELLLN